VRKAMEEKGVDVKSENISNEIELNDKEMMLLKTIYTFPNVIIEAGKSYSPSMIANYAYTLAKQFNTFYQDCTILKEEDQQKMKARVCLTYFTGQVIKRAMHLLGIDVPERM
jgi:arginyl-tRNA synthetase